MCAVSVRAHNLAHERVAKEVVDLSASRGILLQATGDEGPAERGEVAGQLRALLLDDGAAQAEEARVDLERELAQRARHQRHAQAPDIRGVAILLRIDALGRHVHGGADEGGALGLS